MEGEVKSTLTGALVASELGVAVTYSLLNAQGTGGTFIEPGTPVYEGMIVGIHPREEDLVINVCKEKKLTNMRSSTADVAKRLDPPVKMSLEEALDFISSDELVEVTPQNFRLRKKELSAGERQRRRRDGTKDRVHLA
jgi:GTP-binding protein